MSDETEQHVSYVTEKAEESGPGNRAESTLMNGTINSQSHETNIWTGTIQRPSEDTKLTNRKTHHPPDDTKLTNGTNNTKMSNWNSLPDAGDPKIPTLADLRMAGSSGCVGPRPAGATSKRRRLKYLRSLSTTDEMSKSDGQPTTVGHISKKERKKILEEMETKSKLTEYLVSRLDQRVETLDLYMNISLDDELFLARKDMVPWRFRRNEMLDKKWKSLNHVITAQEFVLAVQQAREDRLKAAGSSRLSMDIPGHNVGTSVQSEDTSGRSEETLAPSVESPSHNVDNSGQPIVTSGQTIGTSGQTIGTSGQSAKTHTRIAAQELRNYLFKDFNETNNQGETISSKEQNNGGHDLDPRINKPTNAHIGSLTTVGSSEIKLNSHYPVVGRGTHYSKRKQISKKNSSSLTDNRVVADTETKNGTLIEHIGTNKESRISIAKHPNASINSFGSHKISSILTPSDRTLNNEVQQTRKLTSSPLINRTQIPNRRSNFSALELQFLNSPLNLISAKPCSELKKTAKYSMNAQNITQDNGHPALAFGSHYFPTCQYCGSTSCKGYQRRSKAVNRVSRTAHQDKDSKHYRLMNAHAFMSRVDDIKGIYEQRQAMSLAVHVRVARRLQRVGVQQKCRAGHGVTKSALHTV